MINVGSKFIWRISNHPDLNGIGELRRSARWHTRGRRVVYLAESPTGSLLENLVHFEIDPEDIPERYTRLKVAIPEYLPITQLDPPEGIDWKLHEALTRRMGARWLSGGGTCLAPVPSAITTEAWNYLLNPEHSDAALVQIVGISREHYDSRLFRFGVSRGK